MSAQHDMNIITHHVSTNLIRSFILAFFRLSDIICSYIGRMIITSNFTHAIIRSKPLVRVK